MSKHDDDDDENTDAEHLIAGMVLGAAAAIGVAAVVLRHPRRRVAAFSSPGAIASTRRPIQVIEVRSGTDEDDDVPTAGPRWN